MRCATALTASCLRTHPGFLPGDISQLCIALLGSSYRFTVGRLSVSLAWLGAQAQGQGQGQLGPVLQPRYALLWLCYVTHRMLGQKSNTLSHVLSNETTRWR